MIERDAELREAFSRDLEAALEQAGVEPEPKLVADASLAAGARELRVRQPDGRRGSLASGTGVTN